MNMAGKHYEWHDGKRCHECGSELIKYNPARKEIACTRCGYTVYTLENKSATSAKGNSKISDMQGGWCKCGHHSMSHDEHGCTETFCGCKIFKSTPKKEMRTFLLLCATKAKLKNLPKCLHARNDTLSICSEHHIEYCKRWYRHGYEDAKAGKKCEYPRDVKK